MNPIASIFIAASLSLLLTACGGGGSAAVSTPVPPPVEDPDTGNTEDDGTGEDTDNGEENMAGSGGSGSSSRNPPPPPPPKDTRPDIHKAADAEMDTKTAQTAILATIEGSPIHDFPSNTISPAMGVSAGIATGAYEDIATIETEVEKIKKAFTEAEKAQSALADEADDLKEVADDLQDDADEAMMPVPGLKTAASDAEGKRDRLQDDLNIQNDLIAGYEAEAERLKGLDPTDPQIEVQRAQADAIRMGDAYIQLKSDLETAKAEATAKRTEADNKETKATQLQTDADNADTAATAKRTEADTAAGHVDEIERIRDQFQIDLAEWKRAVGDDEAATETEKAELVFDLLEGLPDNPDSDIFTSDVADLDNPDYHVFARADQPTGTRMTFVDIYSEDNDFRAMKNFLQSDSTVDTATHTSTGLPENHPAMLVEFKKTTEFVPYTPGDTLTASVARDAVPQIVRWNGIVGSLYCDRAGGCTHGSTGRLGSGWYFTPVVSSKQSSVGYDTTVAGYQDSDEDDIWEAVGYIDYGMWLDGDDNNLGLHRRINWVGPRSPANTLEFGASTTLDGSATYTGKAVGLSARKTGAGDDEVFASGHFAADVELRATFDADPMLEGTIDNFRSVGGSGHVDTGWSLELQAAGLSDETIDSTITITNGDGDGRWSADSYGDSGQRPTGFYGGFEAEFYDGVDDNNEVVIGGVAAGVYEASK